MQSRHYPRSGSKSARTLIERILQAACRAVHIEALEPRRMLAGVTVAINAGVLTVTGTNNVDDIQIVGTGVDGRINVEDFGVAVAGGPYDYTPTPDPLLKQFKAISIDAQGDNDFVKIRENLGFPVVSTLI